MQILIETLKYNRSTYVISFGMLCSLDIMYNLRDEGHTILSVSRTNI